MLHVEMGLDLKEPLKAVVSRGFKTAKAAGSLVFTDTELTVIKTQRGVPFQLRYCPALAKKPQGASDSRPKIDPFENPPVELFLSDIPEASPSHILVLNKYPVIPNHFILATKASKPQTGLLEEDDVSLTYACLKAWESQSGAERPGRLFAFFNSGEHSGASQVHRHLQFLPVEDMRGSTDEAWNLLLDRMDQQTASSASLLRDSSLPFVHYAVDLNRTMGSSQLYSRYRMLLASAVKAVSFNSQPESPDEDVVIEKDGKPVISYNLAMTLDRMAICPRRSDSVTVDETQPNSSVSVNGTILGGTLMVKDEREWDILRNDGSVLDSVLTSVGYPEATPVVNESAYL